MSAPAPITGAELRAWREAWGMRSDECSARLRYSRFGVPMLEARRGARPLPAFVARWVRANPPPPTDPTYPPTREGLAAVLAARGLTAAGFARWWGGVGYMAVWHWLRGNAPVPLAVRAWLRVGAPASGRLPFPAAVRGRKRRPGARPLPPVPVPVPAEPAPSPDRPPAPDWVWIRRRRAWCPPAGICTPGETYGCLPHCGQCAHKTDCRELTLSGRVS
jgi:hypothetical protein